MTKPSQKLKHTSFALLLLSVSACSDPDEPSATSATAGSSSTSGATTTDAGSESAGPSSGASVSTTTTTTTSTSTDGDETGSRGDSSGSAESCGDGMLDPGEECDDGPMNDQFGNCDKGCELATCGDGDLQPGESCDEGDNNHPTLYNGCTPLCLPGPRCGDGQVQADEEACETLGPQPGNAAPCVDCQWAGKRFFVSSQIYDGDLGGLNGADAICHGLASAAGLVDEGQLFRAWLSTSEISASEHNAHSPFPYLLIGGAVIADNWDDLTDGTLDRAINLDEYGAQVANKLWSWTDTTSNGSSRSGDDCEGWTSKSAASKGHLGKIIMQDTEWTEASELTPASCKLVRRIYCMEQ